MSNECKQARNVVSTAFIVLLVLVTIMSMSSCGSTHSTCMAFEGWSPGWGR